MGWTTLKQPNGKYAIYSSVSGGLNVWDADEEEILEVFISRAVRDGIRQARDAMGRADGTIPGPRGYVTWEEALESHNEHFPDEKIEIEENTDGQP